MGMCYMKASIWGAYSPYHVLLGQLARECVDHLWPPLAQNSVEQHSTFHKKSSFLLLFTCRVKL